MRLWSLHPGYLDSKGLTALWREGLLAQKVLLGNTRGYRGHPQLARFRQQSDPLAAIAAYLHEVHDEASRRGYRFDAGKICPAREAVRMAVTTGQIIYEFAHLKAKLKMRDTDAYRKIATIEMPQPHPLFEMVNGGIEPWEVIRETLTKRDQDQ